VLLVGNDVAEEQVFLDLRLCDSCQNQSFGGTCRLHHQGETNERGRNNVAVNRNQLEQRCNSLICFTLMMEAIRSSELSVTALHPRRLVPPKRRLLQVTRRYITEDGIIHSHCRENLKSYIALTGWALFRRRVVSPVNYELGFYIPEDAILHSHRSKSSDLTNMQVFVRDIFLWIRR
jgi:hypothetical protein